MAAAVSDMPDLKEQSAVSEEIIKNYQKDGHAVTRNVCSKEEVDLYLPEIAEGVDKYKKEKRKLEDRDTYHKAFIQVTNLWERCETVRKFVFAKRFAKIAAELMQCDGVRIYHDQALFKEPGGGPTPWHQDQYYWPIDSMKTVTMWMPFINAGPEHGALVFASGIQNEGALAQLAISDESADWFAREMSRREIPLRTYELMAGDATWHAGWCPHKAPGNSTSLLRPAMTVIYVDADAKISEPANPHQPKDLEVFFPGQKPGEKIGSPLNPVLYHKDASKIDV